MRLLHTKLSARTKEGLRLVGIDPMLPRRQLVSALALTKTGLRRSLLGQNHKTDLGDSFGYSSRMMYLSPHLEGLVNSCIFASPGCAAGCLISSGQMITSGCGFSRISKRLFFEVDPERFKAFFELEVMEHELRADMEGRLPVVRPNGTSDMNPFGFCDMAKFPEVQFMDYTKRPLRSARRLGLLDIPNYHLTFSLDERPISRMRADAWLKAGYGVAVVVGGDSGTKKKQAKEQAQKIVKRGHLWGYPVVDGDEHDLRFLTSGAHFVILSAKGKALKDKTGFVVRPPRLVDPFGRHVGITLQAGAA